ncbi:hypothetical protein ACHAXR_005511 [Thalassiosira sp. AJA248-18]
MNLEETLHRFLLLPSHVLIILLLEFLNSFRSFGLRFVLYNYITNEFAISDTQAGAILGVKSFIDIGFGLSGSILVDMVGVRRVSLVALSVALVGRALLAFGRSKEILYVALFLFSPCGDTLLSVGLYRVALKKLSTPLTRPLAFGLSYAVSNMSGACVAVVVDTMRKKMDDIHVDNVGKSGYFISVVGGVYTPVRQFIVVTWVVSFLTFLVAYFFLEDWTVLDPDDLDEEYRNVEQSGKSIKKINSDDIVDDGDGDDCSISENNCNNNCHSYSNATLPLGLTSAEPMMQCFPTNKYYQRTQQQPMQEAEDGGGGDDDDDDEKFNLKRRRLPQYKMHRTKYITMNKQDKGEKNCFSPCAGFIFILQNRNTWKVLVFSVVSVPVVLQWTASEISLPPFLERRFGEAIPIYTIQSIHMVGCLIFPPFAQALTSALEDFQVVMPGLWIMAISPIFVAMLPNVLGACIWQIVMTVGQVLWSPRQDSWTECRDQYGHFCGGLLDSGEGELRCTSVQATCNFFLDSREQACPRTCSECPSWEPTDPSTCWYILVIISVTSPVLAWFFLPFLRSRHTREDKYYGIFSMSVDRLVGMCGAPEDQNSYQIYRYIDDEPDPIYKAKSQDNFCQRTTDDV